MYECMSFIALHNYLCFAVHMAINLLNLEYYCNMRPSIVMDQLEPQTYCICVGSYNVSKNFIPIPNGSQGNII